MYYEGTKFKWEHKQTSDELSDTITDVSTINETFIFVKRRDVNAQFAKHIASAVFFHDLSKSSPLN